MIFALLFILSFVVSLVAYLLTSRWWIGSLLCVALFTVNALMDAEAQDYWQFTLIFGIPIVFVASILGPYVVELRRAAGLEAAIDDTVETESQRDDITHSSDRQNQHNA